MAVEAARARILIEESREIVVVLDEERRVLAAGRQVVALGSTPALPVVREVVEETAARADRAGVHVVVEPPEDDVALALRPRMLRVILENLIGNSIRYAGPGATLRLSLRREEG